MSQDAAANKILENDAPAEAVQAVEAAVVQAAEPVEAVPGRPKGARNRRSDALRQLQEERFGMTVGELLTETLFDGFAAHRERGGAPGAFLEERARVMAMRLGIDRGKALEHVKAMADDLMPYVHQKLPIAVEVDQRGIMVAVMSPDGGFASPTGGAAIDLRPAQARLEGAKSDGFSRTDEE
jgi:hypothetical protein